MRRQKKLKAEKPLGLQQPRSDPKFPLRSPSWGLGRIGRRGSKRLGSSYIPLFLVMRESAPGQSLSAYPHWNAPPVDGGRGTLFLQAFAENTPNCRQEGTRASS